MSRPRTPAARRLVALRRFALGITALTLAGHLGLGFEPPWSQPLVALAASYATELLLELVDARARGRRPAFAGGLRALADFLLPAHISGLAVAMLLFSNSRPWPIAFAAAAAIASKAVFVARVDGRWRHFFNPSNLGIALTLLLFPWVGIAPAYQFTETTSGALDWLLPGIVLVGGTLLNGLVTRRLLVVVGWVAAFGLQALVRAELHGTPVAAGLAPATGVAFLLFTFYMVPDPATTPVERRCQLAFGASVGLVYGLLMSLHVVFGLFFSLSLVCAARGVAHWALALVPLGARARAPAPLLADESSA